MYHHLHLLAGREPGIRREPVQRQEPLELVARLPLEGRRAVYLVRVGPTVYVLGVAVGPSNQPIEVRCGRRFVRIGEPTTINATSIRGTTWNTHFSAPVRMS